MTKQLLLPTLLLLLFCSCDVINPSEPIPAYISVDDAQLDAQIIQGTDSEKITDVWLTIDGQFLGAYTLPATFPVLETGEREITLQAGIRDNGINAMPEIYPFLEPFEVTRTLVEEEITEINPVFRYLDITKFAFIEDFDGVAHQFQETRVGRPEQFTLVEDGSFEGGQSAYIQLDTSSIIFQAATIDRFSDIVSGTSSTVYLEVNYRSNIPVTFGVIGHRPGVTPPGGQILLDAGFTPSAEWNKIYFNLSLLVSQLQAEEYQVVFQAFIPVSEGEITLEKGEVWLDNIKLVHF